MNLDDMEYKIKCKTPSMERAEIESRLYVGDCIRNLTEVMKNINTNLEKIANNTEKVEINSLYQNCGPVKLTPKYEGKFYEKVGEFPKTPNIKYTTDTNINKESYVDKNIISD